MTPAVAAALDRLDAQHLDRCRDYEPCGCTVALAEIRARLAALEAAVTALVVEHDARREADEAMARSTMQILSRTHAEDCARRAAWSKECRVATDARTLLERVA